MTKNFYITPQQEQYDAIVVGSGISGGWAAKELTEKGLKTLVLERGRYVEHGKDYITEHVPPWVMTHRGQGNREEFRKDYPVQSRSAPFNEYNKHFFVKDSENPYLFDEDAPFIWVRGYQLGGRSLTWGRQCYRLSDLDFEANAREGIEIDWPIRYRDIAPWYDYVEQFVGISGQAEGLPHLPDGQFLPPMALNCAEQQVKEGLEKSYPGRKMIIGRVAVLTQPHGGRGQCHYCGPCARGCTPGAYFSSLSSTLPAAEKTGNLTIRCDSIVHSVLFDPEKGRATGVRVIDRITKEALEFRGRVVFLCASALGSTQILLNSTSPRFPNGLANSSGALGHYLMDHPFEAGATGEVPGNEDKYYFGNRPNGIYIPRFRNLGKKRDAGVDFLRGYGCQGSASRASWQQGLFRPGLGADFKHALREPGPWTMWAGGWGEMLPRYENYLELDPENTDDWGIPQLRVQCAFGENEQRMRQDMTMQVAEMLEAAGCRNVTPFMREDTAPGLCIHEMGTARMGRDPKTSVLNAYNQAHDVPNLFVTDGACMTSSACQNPSITYMALTARAVDYAAGELQRRNL